MNPKGGSRGQKIKRSSPKPSLTHKKDKKGPKSLKKSPLSSSSHDIHTKADQFSHLTQQQDHIAQGFNPLVKMVAQKRTFSTNAGLSYNANKPFSTLSSAYRSSDPEWTPYTPSSTPLQTSLVDFDDEASSPANKHKKLSSDLADPSSEPEQLDINSFEAAPRPPRRFTGAGATGKSVGTLNFSETGKKNRQDPLTSLLSTFSYSYLARTALTESNLADGAAAIQGTMGDLSGQLDMPVSNAQKNKMKKQKKKKDFKAPLSAALELSQPDVDTQSKFRSNIISADAVTQSVQNVYRQQGVSQKMLQTRSGVEQILQRAVELSTATITTPTHKTTTFEKMKLLQHDLDLNRDVLHDDADPLGPYATGQIDALAQALEHNDENNVLDKAEKDEKGENGEEGEEEGQNGTNSASSPDGFAQPRRKSTLFGRKKLNEQRDAIKKPLPILQKSIFQELDGIVEFANLHYDNVMKALSQHSLSTLYPPELLTVEFFDYRLELFTDAINEDLAALYKAKNVLYVRHLTSLKNDGKMIQEEFDFHTKELNDLFSSSVFDLGAVMKAFKKIPYQANGATIADLYQDEAIGWTSHDTTFVRNRDNTLEDELKLVEAIHTALGPEMFTVNQFKQGLNLSAHRYPGLNVPIERYIQQLSYEHQSITKAVDEYTELTEQLTKMGRASHLTPLQDHVLRWFKPLAECVEKDILECRQAILNNKPLRGTEAFDEDSPEGVRRLQQQQQHLADVRLILPYITQLKATELGCITLHETLSRILNAPSGIRVIDIALAIGRVVNTEANLFQLRQDRANFQRLKRYYPGAKLNEQVIRRAVNNQNKKSGQNGPNASTPPMSAPQSSRGGSGGTLDPFGHKHGEDNAIWSDLIQAKVGSFLIRHMIQASTIRQQVDPLTGKLIPVDSQFMAKHGDGGVAASGGSEVEVPAFSYEHRPVGANYVGYISCHGDVRGVIDSAHTDVQALAVRLLPMVIPPRPWRGIRDGGYLSVPSSIIRSKGSRKQVQAVDASDVSSVQLSLNYLGRVAWGINPNVLSVIEQAWSEGGGLASMPSRRDIPVPPQPTLNLLEYDQKKGRYFSPSQSDIAKVNQSGSLVNSEQLAQQTTQWRQWQRDTQRISQYNADLHSLRCDLTLRLNQAKQLAENPVFFPLNMDFRGRAYPIPPHLNHLGSDLARALLLFHHKKPLGPKGLYWLKAHLAAQFGVDKVSFDDRAKYIEENLELVQDTALRPMYANVANPHYGKLRSLDEPLYPIPREVQQKYARVYIRQQLESQPTEGAKQKRLKALLSEYEKQGLSIDMSIEDDPNECIYPLDGEHDVRAKLPWWQLADNPWQALSTCCEIHAAIKSGDPESYQTGLPVHQDGSCNGLQHYAALGRDFAGGSRVNLTKSDKPQDVYSHVLNEVKRRMEQDIKENDNPLAKMLLPHMARKVVKQTVMTSVYGVTFIGARDQILKQLRDLKDVPWEEASALVLQQQVENRKKFLSKQADLENKNKERSRKALMKNMSEEERVAFLNKEMLEQTLMDDTMDIFGDDPLNIGGGDVEKARDPLGVEIDAVNNSLVDDAFHSSPTKTTNPDDINDNAAVKTEGGATVTDGVVRATTGDNKEVLMSQRQAQEAAMRASSIYLARLTLTSLGTVFSAATRIMSWLTECAGIISKQEQPVSWITPMQLPVVQHYRLISKFQVKTLNQTVTLHHDNDALPVSPQRQRAAFPPNFVHSLDATHMMLTAAQCAQHGLVFSSVHDSYWTHPGDIDKMNALLRDRFIHLYSGPILEDLRESFVLRYPTAEFPPLPERGDLDLEEVRKSPYFFN